MTRKLTALNATNPLGLSPADDPWADFRQIGQLDLTLEFRFTHSLGKVSRFFLELEQQRLMGTRCEHCDAVWMPPRPVCGNDGLVTRWVEVGQQGTLVAAVANTHRAGSEGDPLIWGYAALEGATTLLLQRIRKVRSSSELVPGLRLKVVWSQTPAPHPMETFWFEPDHGA